MLIYLEYHVRFIYFNIKIFRTIEVLGKYIDRFHAPFMQSNLGSDLALIKMELLNTNTGLGNRLVNKNQKKLNNQNK